jgi:hypothetical protein
MLHARLPSPAARASASTTIVSPSETAAGNETMSTPMHATSRATSNSRFPDVHPASSSTNVAARTVNRDRWPWLRVYAVRLSASLYVGGHVPSYR